MILQGGKAGGGSSGGNTIYTGNGTLSGNRTVDLDGHTLAFIGGNVLLDVIEDYSAGILLSSGTNTAYSNRISLDSRGGSWAAGDLGLSSNKTIVTLDDSAKTLLFTSSVGGVAGTYFSLDVKDHSYKIGDISAQYNGTFIDVSDAVNKISIDNTAHNVQIVMNGVTGFSGTGVYTTFTIDGGIITNAS